MSLFTNDRDAHTYFLRWEVYTISTLVYRKIRFTYVYDLPTHMYKHVTAVAYAIIR